MKGTVPPPLTGEGQGEGDPLSDSPLSLALSREVRGNSRYGIDRDCSLRTLSLLQ